MTLADQRARERMTTALGSTLFVEAGAGSGKTTLLVDRIVALVRKGTPLRHIAAVTFTDKAATELCDRVRVKLEAAGETGALDELDGAAIGTLHSFARRILTEHPIEAGLPPLFEVLDDLGSRIAADRRWDELQTRLLQDPEAAPMLRLGFAAGLKLDHLRTLAHQLDANWDLVDERLVTAPEPTAPCVDVSLLRTMAKKLLLRREECTAPTDKLRLRLDQLEAWLRSTEHADDAALLELLGTLPKSGKIGRKSSWSCPIDEIRADLAAFHDAGIRIRAQANDRVLRSLLPRLAQPTLSSARRRVAEGRLQFHDLLVLSRELVRSNAEVRHQLAQQYQRLLLDESQDTDPIQVELAVRIAAGAAADQDNWRNIPVPEGSLFFVGDAKQSIYRFRRADIRTYLEARKSLGETVALTTNFRSTREILGWVNDVFGRLIIETPDAQPAYLPLDPPPDLPEWAAADGPPVVVLGAAAHADKPTANQVRQREAHDIAALVVRAVREGWRVRERTLSLADITILAPSRTSIGGLEQALDEAGIPYRTEAATFVYSSFEVRELLLCAKAVDDPTDQLAVVATLRAPMFGCSDADLWRWKSGGGSWNLFARPPEVGVVADGLAQLRLWARSRSVRAPSELLEDIVERRRLLEAAVDSPRYRETWRRLRFVVDQARAWSESEHGSLREYLHWAAGQADDSARVSETVLPETDTDAVRITTIHASKGLEFPFVIVAGLSSSGSNQRPPVLWPADGGCELKLAAELTTLGYHDADTDERRFEACEDTRLLYVACTRAQDHLAVSLHRSDGRRCPAAVLADVCQHAHHESWTAPAIVELLHRAAPRPADPLPTWDRWIATHNAALANGRRREAESATDIAHGRAATELPIFARQGLAKQPRDLELPPWTKGRYGTAIGRAVHGVLQSVDLATGDDLDELAASQAVAEGVRDATPDIANAARAALDSPIIKRAAQRPHWRETYVGTVVDGTLIEGYVDLLFRDDDGLVLIDYKTDAATTADTIAVYQTQLTVYARAISDAAGEPVTRALLLFLRPSGAVEHLVVVNAPPIPVPRRAETTS
jgi:ATP-dependent helicase/nuclease subunit A